MLAFMQRVVFNRLMLGAAAAGSLAACSAPPDPAPRMAPLGAVPSFEDARSRIQASIARDAADARIERAALPRLYDHGKRVGRAVLLLHGFTNCPQQFDELARMLHARGANVYVPRLPLHGHKNRLTRALANLTVTDLVRCAQETYGDARGLGESVAVMGLSLGGTMALWLAQTQPVDVVVPISPFLMPIAIPRWFGNIAMRALDAIPDMYWWWDPRIKAASLPPYAYPGFPTHALAKIVFLGDVVFQDAQRAAPLARKCTFVINANESAVNDTVTAGLFARWNQYGTRYRYDILRDLGEPRHDIIDPTTFPQARALVYPTLERLALT